MSCATEGPFRRAGAGGEDSSRGQAPAGGPRNGGVPGGRGRAGDARSPATTTGAAAAAAAAAAAGRGWTAAAAGRGWTRYHRRTSSRTLRASSSLPSPSALSRSRIWAQTDRIEARRAASALAAARRRARARSALAAAAGFHVAPTTPAGRDHVAASASRGARGTGRYRGGGATRHGCRARRAPSGGGRRRRRGAAAPASSASSASAAAASASAAAAAAANRSRAAAAPAARASSAAAAAAADAEAAARARVHARSGGSGPSSVSKASRTNLCGNQPVS